MKILVYPRHEIESGNVTADALISIGPSAQSAEIIGIAVPQIPPDKFTHVLTLKFDDIPCAKLGNRRGIGTWYGPTTNDVEKSLDFARTHKNVSRVAVHCEQGKSRSAAIALAILCDSIGEGNEEEAVNWLLDDDGQRCFNPYIVRLADIILKRNGAIEAALDKLCPSFWSWRKYWIREMVFPEEGLPGDTYVGSNLLLAH